MSIVNYLNMANNFNPKEGMQTIQRHQEQVEPAAEELRQRLNEIVTAYQLSAEGALTLMARMSAAYIHLQQRFFNDPGAKDAVEDLFNQRLQHYLALFNMTEVQREMRTEFY